MSLKYLRKQIFGMLWVILNQDRAEADDGGDIARLLKLCRPSKEEFVF